MNGLFIQKFFCLILLVALITSVATQNASFPYQTFRAVGFTPPQMNITKEGTTANGFIFIAPDGPLAVEAAPLIMTDDNELIWQGPKGHAFNFGVQTYKGQQVLAWWNGTIFPEPVGRGYGTVSILNSSYQEIANVSLSGNFQTLTGETFPSNVDVHELYITSNNSIVVTANNVTQTDLRSVGGPEVGWVVDCLVYEINIETNKVLFQWSSLEHLSEIPLNASLYPLGSEGFTGTNQSNAWGYFHINSVAPYEDGYLISSRYLCSALAIDSTGKVKWRLQGRDGGDFDLGNGTNFCYQHDIRPISSSSTNLTLHMHNNANCPIDNGTVPTTGLVLDLDLKSFKVNLEQKFFNSQDLLYSTAQGDFQKLQGGNVFIGHGYWPFIEEYDANGKIVMTAQFGEFPGNLSRTSSSFPGTLSYRAFRSEWTGCPITAPLVAADVEDGQVAVYMSWNGATEYDTWMVYSGDGTENLTLATTVPRFGFETRAVIGSAQYVQVEASFADSSQTSVCKGGQTRSAVLAI